MTIGGPTTRCGRGGNNSEGSDSKQRSFSHDGASTSPSTPAPSILVPPSVVEPLPPARNLLSRAVRLHLQALVDLGCDGRMRLGRVEPTEPRCSSGLLRVTYYDVILLLEDTRPTPLPFSQRALKKPTDRSDVQDNVCGMFCGAPVGD